MQAYCQTLFRKVHTIGLSEIASFLDYQCSQVRNPVKWLNSLEKLIKINIDFFDTRALHHRHTKLICEIGLKRHSLHHLKTSAKITRKKLNGYTDDKEYSFSVVREQLPNYETLEEKIACLQDHIFDYRQNPPDFSCTKEQPFDSQCELEIERLEKQELLLQKINQKKNAEKQGRKMPYSGELKVLCDIFHQLILKPVSGGSTILPWTIIDTTTFICNNFCNPDGSSINPATVRTYLSSSKPENRPKALNQFNI